ncbi:MAG: SUMF1/EgtB/PvdO family nonheme iron enzyme, partial [Bacteroidetes bacterium]|nr:SUMF1/EgtB/PvdO family nonheme iron enzyme [Bacteroidota bacterium]
MLTKLYTASFCLLFVACFNPRYDKVIKTMEGPPGTLLLYGNLYLDETEVSNTYWREYMFWNFQKFGSETIEYTSTIPDTSVWHHERNKELSMWYFRHPAYNDYPMVGISWEQAKNYCKWRTERVMEFYTLAKKNHPRIDYPTGLEYRLPKLREWE